MNVHSINGGDDPAKRTISHDTDMRFQTFCGDQFTYEFDAESSELIRSDL